MTIRLRGAAVLLSAGVVAGAEQDKPKPAATEPFEWSASRRLSWGDYLGRPDMMTGASAVTVYQFSVEHGCSSGAFSFRVAVVFQPQRSWVKTDLLTRAGSQERRVLDHEQGHFDLGEVGARRLRRAFGAVKDPCGAPAAEFNELAAKYILEDADRQRQYDQETVYGVNGGRQGVWESDIRRQLKELAAYVH